MVLNTHKRLRWRYVWHIKTEIDKAPLYLLLCYPTNLNGVNECATISIQFKQSLAHCKKKKKWLDMRCDEHMELWKCVYNVGQNIVHVMCYLVWSLSGRQTCSKERKEENGVVWRKKSLPSRPSIWTDIWRFRAECVWSMQNWSTKCTGIRRSITLNSHSHAQRESPGKEDSLSINKALNEWLRLKIYWCFLAISECVCVCGYACEWASELNRLLVWLSLCHS